jgi:hypothetical protein
MGKTLNLKSLFVVASLFVFANSVFHSCRRQETIVSPTIVQANKDAIRAWLHEKGGAYKTESMTINAPGGSVAAKLDWSKARQIVWNNKSYLDIPYLLVGGGTQVKGDANVSPASFNLVVRAYKNGEYRGAVRTTTTETNGNIVQSYRLLDGREGNVWYRNAGGIKAVAAQRVKITEARYAVIKQQQIAREKANSNSQTVARSVSFTECKIVPTTTYINCNYSQGDTVVVQLCPVADFTLNCPPPPDDPRSNGGGGGAGGGGGPRPSGPCTDVPEDPNGPPVTNPGDEETPYNPLPPCEEYPPIEDTDTDEDPCAKAKALAAKLNTILKDPKVKVKLEQLINNYKNSKNEYGFVIIKDGTGYDATAITTSNSTQSVEFSYPANANVIAIVHTHPIESSIVHSSTDILGMASHMDNPDFVGNIVTHGNSINLLTVSNPAQYRNFLAVTAAKGFYDKSASFGWKEGSSIDRQFDDVKDDFMKLHPGTDATYPSQLYLMSSVDLGKLNGTRMGTGMGVSFQQYNSSSDSFIPQRVAATRKPMTAGGETYLPGIGTPPTQNYATIEIEVDCN